jgi:hypothetical protein
MNAAAPEGTPPRRFDDGKNVQQIRSLDMICLRVIAKML